MAAALSGMTVASPARVPGVDDGSSACPSTDGGRVLQGTRRSRRSRGSTCRPDDLTEFYLVNLLCQYVRVDASPHQADDGQPLALRFARALESGGSEQRARLRSVGDFSLFMSGFFSDSLPAGSSTSTTTRLGRVRLRLAQPLRRRRVRRRVRRAVAKVRRLHGRARRHQRADDAARLTTDACGSVREMAPHGQRRDGQRLVERGIVPNRSIGSRFIQ